MVRSSSAGRSCKLVDCFGSQLAVVDIGTVMGLDVAGGVRGGVGRSQYETDGGSVGKIGTEYFVPVD